MKILTNQCKYDILMLLLKGRDYYVINSKGCTTFDIQKLKKVVVPEGYTSIDNLAFKSETALMVIKCYYRVFLRFKSFCIL